MLRNLATRLGKLTKLYPCLSMNCEDVPLSFVNRYVAFITNEWTAKKSHTRANVLRGATKCRSMSAANREGNEIYSLPG